MEIEQRKHIIVEKCKQCPYNGRSYFIAKRRECRYPRNQVEYPIDTKGKKFPEDCPLEDYIGERCDKIQLVRKKMADNLKKRKKCRKKIR